MELIFHPATAAILACRIERWLRRMSLGLETGRYRYCRDRALVPTSGRAGLVSTVFAAKILCTIGKWHGLAEDIRNAIVNFIASFQEKDGFFRDPWLLAALRKSGASVADIEKCVRAETRQALSLLLSVKALPTYPTPLELTNIAQAQQYMRALPWSNPWAACSHFSHQCFFLAAARATGQAVDQDIEHCLLDELFQHYHPQSGTWYDKNSSPPDIAIQINGVMKAFSGFAWLSPTVYDRLDLQATWKTVHTLVHRRDSCSLFNQLYVVSELSHHYKINNTHAVNIFAKSYARSLREFYHWSEGAFSFYPNRSQGIYYRAPTSAGVDCADLHGTVMQTWALSLLFGLMGVKTPWRVQRV